MKTHDLYAEKDYIAVVGNKFNFSWIIEIKNNEFILKSPIPLFKQYNNTFSTLRRALDHIGYKG